MQRHIITPPYASIASSAQLLRRLPYTHRHRSSLLLLRVFQPSNAAADTISPAMQTRATATQQPAPHARCITVLAPDIAVPLARQRGRRYARRRDQTGAFGIEFRAGGRVGAGDVAERGVIGLAVNDCAGKDGEREGLATATEHGGWGDGFHGSVGVDAVAAAALGGGGESEDGGVVGENIVGGGALVGCWVVVRCEVGWHSGGWLRQIGGLGDVAG